MLGSILVHALLWAALADVQAIEVFAPAATTVEFTLATPEPTPEPIAAPEPEPIAKPTPRPMVARPRPRKRPRPVAAPAPQPVQAPAIEATEGGGVELASAVERPAPTAAPVIAAPAPRPVQAPVEGPAAVDMRGLAMGYLRDLRHALHARRDYPRAALQQRLEGTVLLSITIDAAGAIVDVAVKRSSGHALLDRAAIATVRKQRSLPAAPQALSWKTRAVTLPVAYVLR